VITVGKSELADFDPIAVNKAGFAVNKPIFEYFASK